MINVTEEVIQISIFYSNSQFRDEYTLEQIMKSPQVFGPLTKLQCCPTSDGAAAAIVVSERFVRSHGLENQAMEILGIEMATDTPSTFNEKSLIKLVSERSLNVEDHSIFT